MSIELSEGQGLKDLVGLETLRVFQRLDAFRHPERFMPEAKTAG